MATDAFRNWTGFKWGTSDGGPEWFFGIDGTPSRADWEKWLHWMKRTEKYASSNPKTPMSHERLVELKGHTQFKVLREGTEWITYLAAETPHPSIPNCWDYEYAEAEVPALWVAEIANLRIVRQGFVRRRNPDLGRKAKAFQGEPIPIPQWVLDELGEWVGTTFKALPSGKPRPVIKRR